MFLTYSRVKMFDPSLSFDKDYMVFVAPNPGQNPKYLALVRPFDSLVWSLVLSSIVLLTLVFLVVSKLEEKVKPDLFLKIIHLTLPDSIDRPEVLVVQWCGGLVCHHQHHCHRHDHHCHHHYHNLFCCLSV